MDLAVEDWLLIGLLGLAVVLVGIGASMYYAPRPVYNAEDLPAARGRAEAEQIQPSGRHHQQDGYGTARLGPFPPKVVHPRDLK